MLFQPNMLLFVLNGWGFLEKKQERREKVKKKREGKGKERKRRGGERRETGIVGAPLPI